MITLLQGPILIYAIKTELYCKNGFKKVIDFGAYEYGFLERRPLYLILNVNGI
jgi:hypothetical protein